MSFGLKGVLDRFGAIEWILFRHGKISQPIAILDDFEVRRLKVEMDEQRAALDAMCRAARKRLK